MKKILILLPLLLIVILLSALRSETVSDITEILKKADFHRGGQIKGIVWDLKVVNVENGQQKNELTLLVEASSVEDRQYALITFLEPAKFKGQKLLIRDNNMWFTKIDLRRPVAISSRQRLSGSAANADVASANYFNDYNVLKHTEETYGKKACWVLDLVAKNTLVPYSNIRYWISKDEGLGIQAEFYGSTGKLIKVASFEYNNRAEFAGKKQPFVSKITIKDSINTGETTTLNISSIRFEDFDNSKFLKDRLQD